MRQHVDIRNPKLCFSENLKTLVSKAYPSAKIKADHPLNQLEIHNGEINTEINIDKEQKVIEINSEVKGTGIKLWLFVLIALPYIMLDRFQIIDFHFIVGIMYYGVAFFLASLPGREKAKTWESAKKTRAEEIIQLIAKSNVEFALKDKSTLDAGLYKKEIQSLIGKKIKAVNYFFVDDEFDYDHDALHTIDLGISFMFENDKVISWSYQEEDVNLENDISIPGRYDLSFTNIFKESDLKKEDVSGNLNWKQLTSEPITDIKIYSQKVGKSKIITDLVIETATNKVAVFSVNEPIEKEEQIEIDLSMGNDWTIVVFDEETIKSSERI